jgi:hypothetical protein
MENETQEPILDQVETNDPVAEEATNPNKIPVEDLIHYEEALNELHVLEKSYSDVSDLISEGNEVGAEVQEKIGQAKEVLEDKAEDIEPLEPLVVQESIKYFYKRLGMEDKRILFNTEDATSNPRLAMQMNLEALQDIKDAVIKGLKLAYEKLIEILKAIFKNLLNSFGIRTKSAQEARDNIRKNATTIKDNLKANNAEIRKMCKTINSLNSQIDGMLDPELSALYESLQESLTLDSVQPNEYLPIYLKFATKIESILSQLAELVKPDVTKDELFKKVSDIFKPYQDELKRIDEIKDINAYLWHTQFKGTTTEPELLMIVPLKNDKFMYIGTVQDRVIARQDVTYGATHNVNRYFNIDTVADDVAKQLDLMSSRNIESILKGSNSKLDLIRNKLTKIVATNTAYYNLSNDTMYVLETIKNLVSTIARMGAASVTISGLLVDRANALGKI